MKRTLLIQDLLFCWISNASILLCMVHWKEKKKSKKEEKRNCSGVRVTVKTLCALFHWTCILMWLSAICDGQIHLQGLLLSQGRVRQDSL